MDTLPALTLKHLFDRSVAAHASRPALCMVDEQPMTYAQLGEQVRTLSGVLADRGVRHGDRVAILAESCPHWGVAYFAITTLGATAVPVLPDFHTSEVHHILRHAGARAVFVSERQLPKLEEAQLEDLDTVFTIEDFSVLAPQPRQDALARLIQEGRREFARLRERVQQRGAPAPTEVREADVAAIIYTSGTTGNSK